MKIKLSKTQKDLLLDIRKVIDVLSKYDSFEDFFTNSKHEQCTYTTAHNCNGLYNSVEKYQSKDKERFEEMKKNYYEVVNNQIVLIFAKDETVNKLVQLGYLQNIKLPQYKGGGQLVKLIKDLDLKEDHNV